MAEQEKRKAVSNIIGSLKGIDGGGKIDIINSRLCHFSRADAALGMETAKDLGINVESALHQQE